MDLILWRHAEAGWANGFGRRLGKGHPAGRAGGAMARPPSAGHDADPFESGHRAQQTAQALKRRVDDNLAPVASVAAVLAATAWPDSREPVLVVGHQPTLGEVAAFLLTDHELSWSVRKGAVWWLSYRVRDGVASTVLKVVIGPDFV
jgi:phosphohistidine phosphatase